MNETNAKLNAQSLRAEIEIARQRVAASAEAVAYRTDVKARAKDAVEDGKEKLLAVLAQSFDTIKASLGKAASTAQSNASDLSERARPHVEAALETVQTAADTVSEHVTPLIDTVTDAAQTAVATAHHVADVASDAIASGKDALTGDAIEPAIKITGA